MRRIILAVVLSLPLLAGCALADEWNRTYQVGDKPSLRVDTNDASVEVSRGQSHVMSVRIVSEAINIGTGGVSIIDRQNGDSLDLQVHMPHQYGIHITWHSPRVRVEVQVPQETTLDLHSGDGHIRVEVLPARPSWIQGTAILRSATLPARYAPTPMTDT